MQFTKRQKAVILYLNSKNARLSNEIPGKLIADHLQISIRTLQNEISFINHLGDEAIIESNHKGYYFNNQAISKLHLTPKCQEDDIASILKLLLLGNCAYDLDDLADQYYLSQSALQNKLKKIASLLERYDLTISKKKNRVTIQGTEAEKRHMIHDMIMREIGLTYDSLEIASEYLKNINTVEIQAIILSAIQKHDYFAESCYTTNLVVNILTALSRIHNHCYIEEIYLDNPESMPEYQIARDICDEVNKRFCISITEQDIRYITMLIMGQVKPVQEKEAFNQLNAQYSEELIKIIQATFNSYMLNIDYNTFLPNFIRHIQALLIRARNKQFVINLITENIKETSPFIYDVAVHLAKSLEDYFNVEIIDEEIGLLSIYIGFIIEQSSVNNEIVKILIVSNDYKNIATHVFEKLKLLHSESIDILDVVTPPVTRSKFNQADLIIHTVPLHTIGKHTVLISPFFSTNDEQKVNNAIAAIIARKKQIQNQELLLTYFDQKLYFKNQGIVSKQEALIFLGEQVEKSGLCEPGFTTSVLKREAMSSTCFMGTFAVPHAIELNAKRTCFAILIEENGIVWDDAHIHCVFMIAVCREDRKEFMKLYNGIIQFLFQKDAIELLLKASDFQHFIQCFNQ